MAVPSADQVKSQPTSINAFIAICEAAMMTSFLLQPWHLMLAAMAGFVNEEQQRVIAYIQAEN